MARTKMTAKCEQFIKDNYLLMSGTDIAEKFNIDKGMVYRFLKKNSLVVPEEIKAKFKVQKMIGRTTSTPAIDKILKEQYLITPEKTLGKMVGKSGCFIRKRLSQLELVIPEEIIEKRKQDSYIKKGNVPFNKGKTWDEIGIDEDTRNRMLKTTFKKGNEPQNTLYDGAITIRNDHLDRIGGKQYKYIRLSKGNWELLHRYNWEKINGPIPEGMLVAFIDGDSLNCELDSVDNLELITMEENMMRNTIHNYPIEIKENIMLTKKLQRKIISHEQHNGTK